MFLSNSVALSKAESIPFKKYFTVPNSKYEGAEIKRGALHWAESNSVFIDNSLIAKSRQIVIPKEDGSSPSLAQNLGNSVLETTGAVNNSMSALGKLGTISSLVTGALANVKSPSLFVKGMLPTPQSLSTSGSTTDNMRLADEAQTMAVNTSFPFKHLGLPGIGEASWLLYKAIPWNITYMPRFSIFALGGQLSLDRQGPLYYRVMPYDHQSLKGQAATRDDLTLIRGIPSPLSGIGMTAFLSKYGLIKSNPTIAQAKSHRLFTDSLGPLLIPYQRGASMFAFHFTEGTSTHALYELAYSTLKQVDYTDDLTVKPNSSTRFMGRYNPPHDSYGDGTAAANFGTEFYWDMLFSYPEKNAEHLPKFPYKGWMPVQSYSLTGTSTGTMTVPTLAGDITVPDMYKLPTTISITIPETSWMSVDNWLRAYFAAIFCGKASDNKQLSTGTPQLRILPYKQQTLYITIYWMNEQWIVLRKKTFICIPDIKFSYQGQSTKDVKTHDIQFNIVGTKGLSQVDFMSADGNASNYITMLE
jgi:hypothetical protein